MNEVFIEQLVKRKTTSTSIFAKAGLILVTVIAFAATLIIPFALVIGIVLVIADIYLFKCFDLEYEYTYIKGELSVDKIMGKERRKKGKSFDLSNMEIVALADSHYLDSYNNNGLKVYNYSSLESDAKVYAMILRGNGGLEKLLFDPNEELLHALKMSAPSKVSL